MPGLEELLKEIIAARPRVRELNVDAPLQEIPGRFSFSLLCKREDLSPVNSYKWRGALNAMSVLSADQRAQGVVTASAGNHAQGVALAASRLGIRAVIYMPLSTPQFKQRAVRELGGQFVEIVLRGDSYSDAAEAAHAYAQEHSQTFIHPFDSLYTIAGQGTIGAEVVEQAPGPIDYAFLQIGGGGMASGVGCFLRHAWPQIKIIGVEGSQQACMKAAFAAGAPVTLAKVDTFCDGTAVRCAGDLTFQYCQKLLEEIVTVDNGEVSLAIKKVWESKRRFPETSGAMGLAGLIKFDHLHPGLLDRKRVLVVISGANVDFDRMASIVRQAEIETSRRRFLRLHLSEERGTLLALLNSVFQDLNIAEIQYGKIDLLEAFPVIGFEADDPTMALLDERLRRAGVDYADVGGREDIEFRIIPYAGRLMKLPYFILCRFPERKGALRDFLTWASASANLCYINYASTGEEFGRAFIGFEFDSRDHRNRFLEALQHCSMDYQEVREEAVARMLKS